MHIPFVSVDYSQIVQRHRFALDITNAFTYFQRLIVEGDRFIHIPFVGVDHSQIVQRHRFGLDITNAFIYF